MLSLDPTLSCPFFLPNLLRLALERLRESRDVTLNGTLIPKELHVCSINLDHTLLALFLVLFPTQWGKAPVLADDDLLAARELILRAAEGFDGRCAVCGLG